MDSGRTHRLDWRGFTLVELLVVMGILALLIALLLPALARMRAHSQLVICKSNIRQQLQGHALYGQDFRDAKPPLFQRRTRSLKLDWVSPDIKWSDKPVGQGLLVERKYITLDVLMDPSAEMAQDVSRDRRGWLELPNSGSSYAYFWREPDDLKTQEEACVGATFQQANRKQRRALVMDLNAEAGHPYQGEYADRPWTSHGRPGKVNVGYTDGSVQDFAAAEVRLRYPGGMNEELEWFRLAHEKYGK